MSRLICYFIHTYLYPFHIFIFHNRHSSLFFFFYEVFGPIIIVIFQLYLSISVKISKKTSSYFKAQMCSKMDVIVLSNKNSYDVGLKGSYSMEHVVLDI